MTKTTKTAQPTPETITQRTWQGQQSWNHERIVRAGAHTLRLVLKVDSYDFQSYARVERWDGAKWHQVHHIAGQVMTSCKRVTAYARTCSPTVFAADIAELLEVAIAVCA